MLIFARFGSLDRKLNVNDPSISRVVIDETRAGIIFESRLIFCRREGTTRIPRSELRYLPFSGIISPSERAMRADATSTIYDSRCTTLKADLRETHERRARSLALLILRHDTRERRISRGENGPFPFPPCPWINDIINRSRSYVRLHMKGLSVTSARPLRLENARSFKDDSRAEKAARFARARSKYAAACVCKYYDVRA